MCTAFIYFLFSRPIIPLASKGWIAENFAGVSRNKDKIYLFFQRPDTIFSQLKFWKYKISNQKVICGFFRMISCYFCFCFNIVFYLCFFSIYLSCYLSVFLLTVSLCDSYLSLCYSYLSLCYSYLSPYRFCFIHLFSLSDTFTFSEALASLSHTLFCHLAFLS